MVLVGWRGDKVLALFSPGVMQHMAQCSLQYDPSLGARTISIYIIAQNAVHLLRCSEMTDERSNRPMRRRSIVSYLSG